MIELLLVLRGGRPLGAALLLAGASSLASPDSSASGSASIFALSQTMPPVHSSVNTYHTRMIPIDSG